MAATLTICGESSEGILTMPKLQADLVLHPSGHYLFIIRNGRWDLPKGHMEEGELPENVLSVKLRKSVVSGVTP
jgi:predicted NUDIX family NTP pyrophosphohydrolase